MNKKNLIEFIKGVELKTLLKEQALTNNQTRNKIILDGSNLNDWAYTNNKTQKGNG